jgi:hypothetical protein
MVPIGFEWPIAIVLSSKSRAVLIASMLVAKERFAEIMLVISSISLTFDA